MLLGPLFGTVKCKVFVPFWGFITWTPTQGSAQTCRRAYSIPRPPAVFSSDRTVIAYRVQDTTEYPSPFEGAIFKVYSAGGRFFTLTLQGNYISPHTEKHNTSLIKKSKAIITMSYTLQDVPKERNHFSTGPFRAFIQFCFYAFRQNTTVSEYTGN